MEINVVIICGCMPACSAFFKHLSQISSLLSFIGSKLIHLGNRRSSSISSGQPLSEGGSPTLAKKVETMIDSKEIIKCAYVSGKGYVPFRGEKYDDYQRRHQAKCYAGEPGSQV